MNRLLFYLYKCLAFISRITASRKVYMKLLLKAHKTVGVKFIGNPRYIQLDSMLDPLGGLSIGSNVVISTKVIILTHDYSYNVGLCSIGAALKTDIALFKPVLIDDYSFIGAGSIILPGTSIGKYCVVGAGSVLKGTYEDYSIIVGNPAKKIGDTRDWGEKFKNSLSEKYIHIDKK